MSFNPIKNIPNNVFIPGQETIASVSSDHFLDHTTRIALDTLRDLHMISRENEEIVKSTFCERFKKNLLPSTALHITPNHSSQTTSSPQISIVSSKYAFPVNLKDDASLITKTENKDLLVDPDYMLEAIKVNIEVINHVEDELQCNKSFIIALLKYNPSILKDIKNWIDRDFATDILETVISELDSIVLPNSEDKDLRIQIRDNIIKLCEIRKKILDNYTFYFSYDISNEAYNNAVLSCNGDWTALFKLIATDKYFYRVIPENTGKKSKFVIHAVEVNFETLAYIDSNMCEKLSDEITSIFKKQQIDILDNSNLNQEIFLKVITNCERFTRLMSHRSMLGQNWLVDIMQHKNVKNQKDWILKALEKNSDLVCYVSESLFTDQSFLIECCVLANDLDFVSKEFWSNREFIISIVMKRIKAKKSLHDIWRKIDKSLINDKAFLLELIKLDPSASVLSHTDKSTKDKDFMLKALSVNPNVKRYLDEKMQKDPAIKAQISVNEESKKKLTKKSSDSSSESDSEESAEAESDGE